MKKKNNTPAWYERACKSENEKGNNFSTKVSKANDTSLESEPVICELNKKLSEEFRLRAKNSLTYLCAIYPNQKIGKKIIATFYDSISSSSLLAEISGYNAALFIELNRIFLEEYHEACKHIGEGYRNEEFL